MRGITRRGCAVLALLLWTVLASAQERREDGRVYDNALTFQVEDDNFKRRGTLNLCIYDQAREICVDNLFTAFEIRVYDRRDKELLKSLWMGQNMTLKFKKRYPTASYIVIKATHPFVINKLNGNRVYQDKEMELKHILK